MDDDIIVDDPDDVARTATLTSRFDVVRLAVTGFPDDSVVCRARRTSANIGRPSSVVVRWRCGRR